MSLLLLLLQYTVDVFLILNAKSWCLCLDLSFEIKELRLLSGIRRNSANKSLYRYEIVISILTFLLTMLRLTFLFNFWFLLEIMKQLIQNEHVLLLLKVFKLTVAVIIPYQKIKLMNAKGKLKLFSSISLKFYKLYF